MTLRLIPDDEIDDRMSANPEEPRDDARAGSYEATAAPRSRAKASGPTHWAIVERPGLAPSTAATEQVTRCREPGCFNGGLMHADPRNSFPERVICGWCQGKINRERVGGRS